VTGSWTNSLLVPAYQRLAALPMKESKSMSSVFRLG
jgi:hypothetical protein